MSATVASRSSASAAANPTAVSAFGRTADVGADGFEHPRSVQSRSKHKSAKSKGLPDCLAALSIASNCRCVSPSVGEIGRSVGRRTYSAGSAQAPSSTQVRSMISRGHGLGSAAVGSA
jgi:hypothetical protein